MDWPIALTAVAAIGGLMGGFGTLFNAFTAFRISNRVALLSDHVAEVKTDVAVVKKQGNHTQDLLVDLTEREAHARGMSDQRTLDSPSS